MNDVIIIGGGPAGLSAALILARSRRSVLLFDSQKQRNLKATNMHGYLSRDGIPPLDFLNLGRAEIERYGVQIKYLEIVKILNHEDYFDVIDLNGNGYQGRKLLIATGMKDFLPEIPGIEEFYGKSVFHCPYCDGYELSDKRIVVYARGKAAAVLPLSLLTWSKDITLLTDGPTRMEAKDKGKLNKYGIPIIKDRIKRIEGTAGNLKKIILENNISLDCDAMFFSTGQKQRSDLAVQLGCLFSRNNHIITDKRQRTNVKGVYAAGDAIKDMSLVIVAAGEGAKAGVSINMELQAQ